MAQRKSWSKQEDKLLLFLREERAVKKWCEIAQILHTQFGVEGRNGKQCRQRFHNHLDSKITKAVWTTDEDSLLVRLHNELGNRWAQISRQIPGRTDNCVKNRFYTKFRRSLRLINDCIKIFWKGKFKPLKQTIISKIIEFSNEDNKKHLKSREDVFQTCVDLKTRMLDFSEKSVEEVQQSQLKNRLQNLIEEIAQFNRKNRKKGKKRREAYLTFQEQNQDDEKDEEFIKDQNFSYSNEENEFIESSVKTVQKEQKEQKQTGFRDEHNKMEKQFPVHDVKEEQVDVDPIVKKRQSFFEEEGIFLEDYSFSNKKKGHLDAHEHKNSEVKEFNLEEKNVDHPWDICSCLQL